MRVIELPPHFRPHAAVVETFDDGDVSLYLTDAERERVAPFRSQKRRHEWIASRIALRNLALARGVMSEAFDLHIDSDARPPTASSKGRSLYVSFSHSANAGAAALSDRRIGVDLEQIRAVEPRLKKFFLSEDESRRADALSHPAALIHLWAAKEAAFKLVASLTLLKEIELHEWVSADAGLEAQFRGGELSGTIRTAQLDEQFILALAQAD